MATLNLGKVRPALLGECNSMTVYKYLDGVSYKGSYYFYINKIPSAGNPPTNTEYWELAAQKGDKGDKGDMGDIWDASLIYNFPEIVARPDGHTYRCIGNDVTGAEPENSVQWVRITTFVDAPWSDGETFIDGATFIDVAAFIDVVAFIDGGIF